MASAHPGRLVVTIAILALLTGCASTTLTAQTPSPPASSPQASPSVSSTPSATPSPSPAPAPTVVADLVISPEGVGPILVGAPPEESGLISYDPEWCAPAEDPSLYGYSAGDPAAGRWYQSFDPSPEALTAFGIHVQDGKVAYLDIRDESLRTAEGIGLGSSLEELTAAYPDLMSTPPTSASTVHYIVTSGGRITFEVPSIYDVAGTVQVLLVLAADQEEMPNWFATDAGAQSCL